MFETTELLGEATSSGSLAPNSFEFFGVRGTPSSLILFSSAVAKQMRKKNWPSAAQLTLAVVRCQTPFVPPTGWPLRENRSRLTLTLPGKNHMLLGTSASLLVTSALLVVKRSY